ncbi:MAG: S9 family peptidase [Bacteroidales bacterium]|nr:S9 family peptidase [Bacteroidales bacterium]
MYKIFVNTLKPAGLFLGGLLLVFGISCVHLFAQSADDPFLWLEDVEGEKQLEWVTSHNDRTLDYITKIDGYQERYEFLYDMLTSDDKLPYPRMHGDYIYNFWQDENNPRGLWRRIAYADYLESKHNWETVIDIDQLCKEEQTNWAFDGTYFLYGNDRDCAVRLSKGGSDAVVIREFDLKRKVFIEGGFYVAEAKSGFEWIDESTVYVATDFGDGTLTYSGYPRIVKRWMRGTSIKEAETVLEVSEEDLSAGMNVIYTEDQRHEMLISAHDFYNIDVFYIRDNKSIELNLPDNFRFEIFKDKAIVQPLVDWQFGEQMILKGTVVSVELSSLLEKKYDYQVMLENRRGMSVESIDITSECVLVNTMNNIKSELLKFRYKNDIWISEVVDLPENGLIEIMEADRNKKSYFLTYESPVQPTGLYVDNEDGEKPKKIMSLPDYFNTDDIAVDQNWVESKDGTRIPYFVIHKREMEYNADNPVIQYGYGGFQISEKPYYSGSRGKLWLEKGGVYVIANIRGGGEFGPDWHLSAIKENKQRSYDDFIAVTEDLIQRKITSPQKIGIYGGSNGGLLVGAVMVQRPDLYKAVACFVPLLDMKRYSKLLAGNSWMAEYGNPDIPEEWAYISKYSPYQNVKKEVNYPVVLFLTSTRDDRVHPGHARKMTALMEEMGYNVYLFENTEGGHGASYTPDHMAKVSAMYYSFFYDQLME